MSPIISLDEIQQIIHLQCDFTVKELAKRAGGRWNQSLRCWDFAFDLGIIESLIKVFPDLDMPAELRNRIVAKIKTQDSFMQFRKDAEANLPFTGEFTYLKLQPYNYQKHGIKCGSLIEGGFLFADQMGLGKQCVNGTPVLAKSGWKAIETLEVGERVYGKDGTLHSVTGVFPQGERDIYRVMFSDETFADVGLEHLWMARSRIDRKRQNEFKVVNTEFIKEKIWYTWEIPLVEPIDYPVKNQTIPAYIVGVLIADGSLIEGTRFVPGDKEVPDIVSGLLEKDYILNTGADYGTSTAYQISYVPIKNKNPWMEYIRHLKLNVSGEYKFIPEVYLRGSIEQRKELLSGLLDGDGTVNGARTRYSTSSKKLADDVVELVQSLGGMAVVSITKGRKRIRNGVVSIELDNYNISIRTSFNPFKKRSNIIKWKKSSKLVKNIVSVEHVKKDLATCISVDSPDHLYIIKDYIVTHNTIQSIAVAIERKNQGAKNCLVVCPASVKYNWLEEIHKFTHEKAMVVDGDVNERSRKWVADGYFFKITNYDIIVRDLFWDNKPTGVDDEGKETFKPDNRIHNYKKIFEIFDILICDEVHYLKTHSSLRTRSLKLFKTPHRLGLTGTPLDGRLEELHSVFEFIKPNLFPSKSRFLETYAKYDYWGKITGYVKIDEVKSKIEPYYIRRLKKNVLLDLPDKTYKDEYVELSDEASREYKLLAKRKHEITEEKQAVVAVVRCRQFCDFPELLDLPFSSDKFASLKEILEEVVKENKQKVIIFSQYKKVIDLLEIKLNAFYKILRIDGGVDNKKRQELCNQFNSDMNVDLMLMTDAGAVGINLQSASYVIHYDDSYSPSIMRQREDRAHRIGQKNAVTIIRFVCKDTVEERVREIIDTKSDVNKQIMDEDTTEATLGTLTTRDLLNAL